MHPVEAQKVPWRHSSIEPGKNMTKYRGGENLRSSSSLFFHVRPTKGAIPNIGLNTIMASEVRCKFSFNVATTDSLKNVSNPNW